MTEKRIPYGEDNVYDFEEVFGGKSRLFPDMTSHCDGVALAAKIMSIVQLMLRNLPALLGRKEDPANGWASWRNILAQCWRSILWKHGPDAASHLPETPPLMR